MQWLIRFSPVLTATLTLMFYYFFMCPTGPIVIKKIWMWSSSKSVTNTIFEKKKNVSSYNKTFGSSACGRWREIWMERVFFSGKPLFCFIIKCLEHFFSSSAEFFLCFTRRNGIKMELSWSKLIQILYQVAFGY